MRFASTSKKRSASDGDEAYGYEEDNESHDDDDEDFTRASQRPSSNGDTSTKQKRRPQILAPASDPGLTSRYTLIRYATGQFLEDEFSFSLYNVKPHELLEIHNAHMIMPLPRAVLPDYLSPYFHARVNALREVYDDDAPEGSRRPRLEWRERWVHIRDGFLSLCRGRDDKSASHHMSLSSLVAINGSVGLGQLLPLPTEQRIICVNFSEPDLSPAKPEPRPTEPPQMVPRTPQTQQMVTPHGTPTHSKSLHRSSSTLRRAQGTLRTATSSTKLVNQQINENEEFSEDDHVTRSEDELSSPVFATPPSPQFAPPSSSMRFNFGFDSEYKDVWEKHEGGNEADTDRSSDHQSAQVTRGESPSKLRHQNKKRRKRKKQPPTPPPTPPKKEVAAKGRGQWLVLNMRDDDSYYSLLRILHQHHPDIIVSSFLKELGFSQQQGFNTYSVKDNTTPLSSRSGDLLSTHTRRSRHSSLSSIPSSLLTAPRPPSPTQSLMSQRRARSISPVSTSEAFAHTAEAKLKPPPVKPYPEWRKKLVHRAQVSGLGKEFEEPTLLILLEKLAAQDGVIYQRLLNSNEDSTQPDDFSDSDHNQSDTEWRGWVTDLQRQIDLRTQESKDTKGSKESEPKSDGESAKTQISTSTQSYRDEHRFLEPMTMVHPSSHASPVSPAILVSPEQLKGKVTTRITRKPSLTLTQTSSPNSMPSPEKEVPKRAQKPSSSSLSAYPHDSFKGLPSIHALPHKLSTPNFGSTFLSGGRDTVGTSSLGGVHRRSSLTGPDLKAGSSIKIGSMIKWSQPKYHTTDHSKQALKQEKEFQKEKKRQEKIAKELEKPSRRYEVEFDWKFNQDKGKARETTPEPELEAGPKKSKPKLSVTTAISPKDIVHSTPDQPPSPTHKLAKKPAVLRRPKSRSDSNWGPVDMSPPAGQGRSGRS